MKKNLTEEQAAVRGGVQKRAKLGTYTVIISLVVLAVLTVINLLVKALPTKYTILDTSANQMYSISESSEKAARKIKEDITLYLICDSTQEKDTQVETFLTRYATLNAHITIKTVDPVTHPNFTAQYTDEKLNNYSVIVESAKRYRVIDYMDMFYYEGGIAADDTEMLYYYYMYYGTTPALYFNGENVVTAALDYVTTDHIPNAYLLSGHNESALPATLQTQISNNNIRLAGSISLLTQTALPEDCHLLIIYAPTTDLNTAEAQIICTYLQNGGKVFLITAPGVSKQPNLLSIAHTCGFTAEDGIIMDTDTKHYVSQPYYLIPNVETHEITEALRSTYYIAVPLAHGIKRTETVPAGVTIAPLFTTTDSAYTVAVDAKTTAKTDESAEGSFWVGACAVNETGGKLIWIPSAVALTDSAESITGANYAYFNSMTSWLCPHNTIQSTVDAISMDQAKLVVTESAALLWSAVLILIVPIAFIVIGLVIWIRRRKR